MFSGITMNKRHLLVLCLCGGLISVQGTTTVKLLPVYAVRLGADPAVTGLFVAFAFLTVTLGNITGGWLSDRLGIRKPILLISCAAWIPIALSMTQATDLPRLILLTGLLWFPGGVALAMVNIITALSAGEGERGKVFGLTTVAAAIGGLVAGAAGGPVAQRWGFPTLFVVMAADTALLLVLATLLPDPRTAPQPHVPGAGPARRQLGVGHLLWLLLAVHLLVRLANLIGGLGSPLAMTGLGFDAAAVSSAIAVGAAVTLPLPLVLGWLSDRFGRKRCLVVCYATGAVGLLLLMQALSLWQFWLATSLLTVAERSSGVAKAYAADLVPRQAIGRGMSLFESTSLFAGILGLSGAGYMMQTLGLAPTFLLGACLPLLAFGLLLRLRPSVSVLEPRPAAQASA